MAEYPYIWADMDVWKLVLMGEAKTEMYRQLIEEMGEEK